MVSAKMTGDTSIRGHRLATPLHVHLPAATIVAVLCVCYTHAQTFVLPWWHPTLQTLALNRVRAPSGHPNMESRVRSTIRAHTDEEHDGDIDCPEGFLCRPDEYDNDHPNLDRYFVPAPPPANMQVSIGFYHPDVDASYRAGVRISTTHPSIQSALLAHLPSGHPNVDTLLANPSSHPIPDWHPRLSALVSRRSRVVFTVSVSPFHLNVDSAFGRGESMPASHPSVHDMMVPVLSATHPNVNDMLTNPAANPLPNWHPPLEDYISRRSTAAVGDGWDLPSVSVAIDHPDIDRAYARGEAVPSSHPKVGPMMSDKLPPGHPDVDALLADPLAHPLPSWHPRLENMVQRRSFWSPGLILSAILIGTMAFMWLLRASRWLRAKLRGDSHQYHTRQIPLHENFTAIHNRRRVDDTTFNPVFSKTTPSLATSSSTDDEPIKPHSDLQHTPNGRRVPPQPRPRRLSAAGGTTPPNNEAPTLPPPRRSQPSLPLSSSHPTSTSTCDGKHTAISTGTPPTGRYTHSRSIYGDAEPPFEVHHDRELPHRRLAIHTMRKRHAAHRPDEPMYDHEAVKAGVPVTRVAYEKASSVGQSWWVRTFAARIPGTQWTNGDAVFCVLYIAANVAAVLLSPNYPIDRGLGSLAAANTMFLVLPATRNNILTWVLGLSFDHIVLQHRFLGRVTIGVSVLHFGWYAQRLGGHFAERPYWTGAAALACGLGIVATTTNFMRRRHFNVFFWTHYLFFGFFAFAFVHVRQARPFLAVAMGTYALDKLLRAVWTLAPRKTTLFWNRGDRTAQVRFPKNALNRLMGRHKVGQYVFLNFPELSLTEWHPYSVSSGPKEDVVEVHIRALGDHTNRIVALSKQCAVEKRQTLVRCDGPYGYLNFTYSRYGVLFLAGGGIGITPVMSLLADIYGEYRSTRPHCMRRVCVVWVMPHADETEIFLDRLLTYDSAAKTDTSLPELELCIHCTRAKANDVTPPVMAGRPDFNKLLDQSSDGLPTSSTLVFACGPGRMVNQLWDETIKRTRRGRRVDFHHETFEF
eukprot:m.138613 g.138613  ORF g.138613 m.138613 type:complete len:1032 (-) comp11487_c0_seq1:152-3247(-)